MLAQKIIETVSGYIRLEDFTRSASANVSSNDAKYASSTVLAVRDACNPESQKHIKLDISSFVLICGSDGVNEDGGVQFVRELVEAARVAAPGQACSSVLAGHASESDEYADIGLVFSSGTLNIDPPSEDLEKDARAVLSSLGLDASVSAQITPLSLLDKTKLPIAFNVSAQTPDVQRIALLLSRLSHRFAFSVSLNETVFHFLLGQLPDSDSWLGLLGLGTTSD
ncbi:uncharacterized protein FOMMEDRAFT_155423 [Fomitiporia mediterranea MF3/22]|uniref:uncharacterized protein n=1 Tax=Fomitiporia mediterranea (strain MF3/22) TaxID=694068 RepID=UPI0004408F47|nr:uncharacterized protein FOMMEDRAFT_155423 [Fomitiporia mediterranea MF3/22]EJD04296.1 hypothetical protein FOMMEDRAFT_155423 [Fomitiporia mediterranea MF3/22]